MNNNNQPHGDRRTKPRGLLKKKRKNNNNNANNNNSTTTTTQSVANNIINNSASAVTNNHNNNNSNSNNNNDNNDETDTSINNNNNENIQQSTSNKARRVSTSPLKNDTMDDTSDTNNAMEEDSNDIQMGEDDHEEDNKQLLKQVFREAASISQTALKIADGAVAVETAPYKVSVGNETRTVASSDASKFFSAIVSEVRKNNTVSKASKTDMSSIVRIEALINPNPGGTTSTKEEERGDKMGDVNVGAIKGKVMVSEGDVSELVNNLDSLGLESRETERDKQESALLVEHVRTSHCQWLRKKKTGRGAKPNTTAIANELKGKFQSVNDDDMKEVVDNIVGLLQCKTVKEAKQNRLLEQLSEFQQAAMMEFWNGYPEDTSAIYNDEVGNMNAVDDRLCYLNAEVEVESEEDEPGECAGIGEREEYESESDSSQESESDSD